MELAWLRWPLTFQSLQCSGPWNLLCCYRVTLEDGQLSQFGKLNRGISKAFQVPCVLDRTSFGTWGQGQCLCGTGNICWPVWLATLPWHFGSLQPRFRPNSEHFWANGLNSVFSTIYVDLFSHLKYKERCSEIFRLGPIFRPFQGPHVVDCTGFGTWRQYVSDTLFSVIRT